MEEIDLHELFEYFKGKLGIIIMITTLVCLLGCAYGMFIQKPMYKSYTTVILGGNETTNSQTITQNDIAKLYEKLDNLVAGDILVLAGSIPSSMSDDIYQTIMRKLEGRDILIAVDATSSLLLNVLEYHPFVIKPNHHELGEIFGVKLTERHQVVEYAKDLSLFIDDCFGIVPETSIPCCGSGQHSFVVVD